MERFERFSSVSGALFGGILAGLIAFGFVENSNVWPAILIGSIVGFSGGLFGQGHIEGMVMAGISLVLLFMILSMRPLADVLWFKEIGTGLFVGNAVGWYLHGLFGVIPFFQHKSIEPLVPESSVGNENS